MAMTETAHAECTGPAEGCSSKHADHTWYRCHVCTTCDELCSMMVEIRKAWEDGSNETCEILWSIQDGYGIPGFYPEQGYDWSGIRDSSDEAVRAMFAAIHA